MYNLLGAFMFNKEIKEKILEKIEYDFYIFKEYFIVNSKLLFKKDNVNIKNKFNEFIKDYYSYSYLEYKILIYIRNVVDIKKIDLCLNILEELENIFFKQFNYNEYVLNGFYDAILNNDLNRASFKEKEFESLTIDIKEEFIKKLKK